MPSRNANGPRAGRSARAEDVTRGPGRGADGTDHGRHDPEGWARALAAARGCRCAPTIVPHTYGPRLVYVTVCHDDDCPVVGEVVA